MIGAPMLLFSGILVYKLAVNLFAPLLIPTIPQYKAIPDYGTGKIRMYTRDIAYNKSLKEFY